MTSSPPSKLPGTVGELLRQRLQEIQRSSDELAEALGVPAHYIDDLMAGSRRPPLPERTDIYGKMTSFLRLGRNDVVACARAERAGAAAASDSSPQAEVRGLLLALCEPATARELEERRARRGGAELAGFLQRVLDVTQGAVRRVLDDQIGLRLAAQDRGSTYLALRFKVLEFLDATADTLTTADLVEFLQPRIARWDVALDTGVVRVVLRAPAPRERPPRQELRRAKLA
jgi:hypothetical protein